MVFDDDFTTTPFLKSEDLPPHWTSLLQSCSKFSTDEAYCLTTMWMYKTDSYPRGGPSNEEFSSAIQLDVPWLHHLMIQQLIQK